MWRLLYKQILRQCIQISFVPTASTSTEPQQINTLETTVTENMDLLSNQSPLDSLREQTATKVQTVHRRSYWDINQHIEENLTSHTDTIRFHLKNNTTPSYNSKEKTQNNQINQKSQPDSAYSLNPAHLQQTQNATTINNRIHVESYVQQHPRNSRRVFQSTIPWNQLNYKHPRTFTINTVKQASRFTMYRVMGHMQTARVGRFETIPLAMGHYHQIPLYPVVCDVSPLFCYSCWPFHHGFNDFV